MFIISPPKAIITKILGEQKKQNTVNYRPLFYIKETLTEDGILLLNLITYELIFLNLEEKDFFTKCHGVSNKTVEKLIEKWFLVPEDTNDLNLVKQVENIACISNKVYSFPKYSSFEILPTTDCDARCYYCFEHGVNKKHMSEKTASDVAEFILKNKVDSEISIHWFGGEPLYNSKAMDIICDKLKRNNVVFKSSITTNGYLFDEEMIEKAVNLWNIKKAQVTLDGTEKIYNKIKNFIYKDENAYKRVLNNIELLLKAGVHVQIRMNMTTNNEDDLYILADELTERFKEYSNVVIYSRLIMDESCARIRNTETEIRTKLVEKQAKLEDFIYKNKKRKFGNSFYEHPVGHCMADISTSVLINPEGALGKCQFFVDSNFIGSIYSDELDYKKINWYNEIKTLSTECDKCIFRPLCVFPKCCFRSKEVCIDLEKQLISERLSAKMIKFYNDFKQNNKS